MNYSLILFEGFIATSLMTSFSYFASKITAHQFREPKLLNVVFSNSKIFPARIAKNHVLGWIIHYLVGYLFVMLFEMIWAYTYIPKNIIWSLILGLCAGLIGVLIWMLVLAFHNNPPQLARNKFYIQLVIAHIIFGLGVILSFYLIQIIKI